MRKNLIALAVAAALAAPAVALADTTLYGRIHMSIDSLDNDQETETYVNSNSSRIGIKGSEDLGNGQSVVYQWENAVASDTGTWNTQARDTFIGLKGDFGTLLTGRLPLNNQWFGKATLFGDQIGEGRSLTNGDFGSRGNNSVQYITPDFSGLTARLSWFADESVNTNNTGDIWGANLAYANGPIDASVTYFTTENAAKDDTEQLAVTGGYDFGDFRIIGAWINNDDDNEDVDSWTIGGSMNLGDGKLKLQYIERDEYGNMDDESKIWAIGYDHALSKRTTVYVAYAQSDNDRGAADTVWGGGHGGPTTGAMGSADAAGDDTQAFSLGIAHNF